jgi:membrane-bound serine protease (ClpP class)
VTSLRPAGKARIGDKLLDVVAEADFIDQGTPIVVVRSTGLRTVVARRPEQA